MATNTHGFDWRQVSSGEGCPYGELFLFLLPDPGGEETLWVIERNGRRYTHGKHRDKERARTAAEASALFYYDAKL